MHTCECGGKTFYLVLPQGDWHSTQADLYCSKCRKLYRLTGQFHLDSAAVNISVKKTLTQSANSA
jgi:hypothetical protein